MTPTAVLLASFGGPEGPDEVMPFLERVTAGRGVPPERLVEVSHHYLALGGVSPINAQNRALLAALRAEFDSRGIDLPLYWGNRNSAPFFDDVVKQMADDGHTGAIALVTSAYSSYSGCRQYRENIAAALDRTGLADQLAIRTAGQYFDSDGFVEPFARGVVAALQRLNEQGIDDSDIVLLCSTHSIPESMAATSGPGASATGEAQSAGWYVAQHTEAMARIARRAESVRGRSVPEPRLVFQSRSGPPSMPWLEPDVNDALRSAAASGTRAAVVAPIGFISDHVEVIWDLDHEAAETAAEIGLSFERVGTPGIDPAFVAALAAQVEGALAGAPGRGGCSPECCPNPRAPQPVIPGPPGASA